MSAIAFDIEIAAIPEKGVLLDPFSKLGISVAAGVDEVGMAQVWYGMTEDGFAAPRMSEREVLRMLDDLARYDTIITWNGAVFDFLVAGVEAGDLDMARSLARGTQHIDLMMLFCAGRRHRLGLKAAAAACGSHKGGGGIESGLDAPALWAAGEYDRAVEYVLQDARATMDVYRHLSQYGGFRWRSSKGYLNTYTVQFPRSQWSVAGLLGAEWTPAEYWITSPVVKDDFMRW